MGKGPLERQHRFEKKNQNLVKLPKSERNPTSHHIHHHQTETNQARYQTQKSPNDPSRTLQSPHPTLAQQCQR